MIDLRSDTVTKPSKEMLAAMMSAEVGDDVFGEDPTVAILQDKLAKMFGIVIRMEYGETQVASLVRQQQLFCSLEKTVTLHSALYAD